MSWDNKTILMSAALGVLVVLGMVWIAMDLRRQPAGLPAPSAGAPAPPRTPPVEKHAELVAGEELAAAGRLDEAAARFAAVPPDDPGYVLALDGIASILMRDGDLEGAKEKLLQVIGLQSDNPEAWVNLAGVDYRLGRVNEAEIGLLRAIELDPSHVPARYRIALYRVAQGRIVEAIPAYARARQLDVGGQHAAAAEGELRDLAASRQDLAVVHYALAFFANKRGDRKEEVELLTRYLELEPDGVAAETARGLLDDASSALAGSDAPDPESP